MIRFWSLEDVPELHGMPKARQRLLRREALTRSITPSHMLIFLAILFVAVLLAGSATSLFLPTISPMWTMPPVAMVVSFILDVWIRQPAARRWLREHVQDLDRYVPA